MNTTISNRISQIIENKESKENNVFKPNRLFFKQIGIGQRRFWQIVRKEKSLTFLEMQRLANYFNVHILELHESTIKFLPNEPITN